MTRSRADLEKLLDACIHCGLCLPACPTYGVTGSELDAPRGRIDLVRGLADGSLADRDVAADHLGKCLGCRACEPACPSGVAYGEILHEARERLRDETPRSGTASRTLTVFASPFLTRWAMRGIVFARATGLLTLATRAGGSLAAAARLAPDARWRPWSSTVPSLLPATAERRGSVALLPGCVMDQGFAGVHAASAACLRAAGFDVHVPHGPLCCGALHAHAGEIRAADACARRLGGAVASDVDALVVDAAGCGSHLKETPGPWHDRTFDVLEFLDRHAFRAGNAPIAARFGLQAGEKLRVAYSDPCHLAHAQGVREAPRRLLATLADVELVPLHDADRCCGSAGIYNLEQPWMAEELLRAKVAAVRDAGADVLATANPGCQLQIAAGLRDAGLRVSVTHVVELLALSLEKPAPAA